MNVLNENINNIFFLFISFNNLDTDSTLTNKNLPLDTIEALAWGSNLDWGLIHQRVLKFSIFWLQRLGHYLLNQIL